MRLVLPSAVAARASLPASRATTVVLLVVPAALPAPASCRGKERARTEVGSICMRALATHRLRVAASPPAQ